MLFRVNRDMGSVISVPLGLFSLAARLATNDSLSSLRDESVDVNRQNVLNKLYEFNLLECMQERLQNIEMECWRQDFAPVRPFGACN